MLSVVVKQRIGAHSRDEGCAVGLDISLSVDRPAHNLGWLAVPHPIHLKPRLGFRECEAVDLRRLPRLGRVGAHLNLGDLAVAAPGNAHDAVISRSSHHRA